MYRQPGRPVFLTTRAAAGARPFVLVRLNEQVIAALLAERLRAGCALYAYCLMPDHLHLLAAPASDDGSPFDLLRRFKGLTTRIAWSCGIAGRLWQPRCYDQVLRSDESIIRVAEYIINNPVRRGLVGDWQDYPWTGLPDPIL